jgi:hypothetical protein
MTTVDAIKQTKSYEEAILVIARALDDLVSTMSNASTSTPSWGDGAAAAGPSWGDHPGSQTSSDSQPQYEAIEIPVNVAEVAALEREYEEANQAFELGRKSGLDKAALVDLSMRAEGIRGRLDLAKHPGSIVPTTGDMVGQGLGAEGSSIVNVYEDPERVVYDLPVPTDEQKAQRRALAEAVDLPGSFPIVMRQTDEAIESIIHNYEIGGPLWLYLGDEEGRTIIMAQPKQAREAMVHDVWETTGDVRFTHEFARDVMKEGAGQDDEESDHLEEFKEHTWQMSDHGGQPLGGNIPAPSFDH